ncbi:DUF7619 domain-containing protein [Psychroserpens sp.]
MKNLYTLLITLLFSFTINAQIINIPDANFKNALISEGVDINNNGEIEISEAQLITDLFLASGDINSLTGIEYFINLEELNCRSNNLTTLDLTQNTQLQDVNCVNNQLSSIASMTLNSLEDLSLGNNQLSFIDLSGYSNLKTFSIFNNNLTNLDLSQNTQIEILFCGTNPLTNIDLSQLTQLKTLYLNDSQYNSVDFSQNIMLETLRIDSNNFSTIDLTNNISLEDLNCNNNQFSTIDLTNNINLYYLRCSDNQFSTIDISSLNNLRSIFINNNSLGTLNNIIGLQNNIYGLGVGSNQLTSLDISPFVNLESLDCSNNQLSSLDLSNATSLGSLICNQNQLTTLDLSNTNGLFVLSVSDNLLTSIDISNCMSLETLYCENNSLTTINVSNNSYLCDFYCDNNEFTSLILGDSGLCFPNYVLFNGNPNLSVVCTTEANFDNVQIKLDEYGYTDCAISSYCFFEPNGEYFIVQGQALLDIESNGCDVSDTFATNQAFNISSNDFYNTFYANSEGEFELYISSGTHTITPVFENTDYFTASPSSITVEFPADASPFMQDFCITPNGTYNDLEITIIPLEIARPGFDTNYKLIYKNKGTTTLSGDIYFGFQNLIMEFVSSAPANESGLTDLLSYSFTDLTPFESREIYVTMNINSPMETPPVNGNDVLTFITTISSSETDETPDDNTFELNQTVVNSFDPNDKTCLEGEFITPEMVGDYVHYMIRFENTGTASAVNIVVKDDIDRTKYDLSTLVPLNASHDFVARIKDNASDHYVEFIFENINLPFDDANNDGYVLFKIKTLDTLTLNDSFENNAEIYFDFNFLIVTNIAQTTIATLSTEDFELANNAISLYPNPTTHSLTLKSMQAIKHITIYDISGRSFKDIAVIGVKTELTMSTEALSTGTYFVKIKTTNGEVVKKIIKD